MTVSDHIIGGFRFGLGRMSNLPRQELVANLMNQVRGEDLILRAHPALSDMEALKWVMEARRLNRDVKKNKLDAVERRKAQYQLLNKRKATSIASYFARAIDTDAEFRERLVWFWADHFAVAAYTKLLPMMRLAMINSAIRPNITGRFVDLLTAADLHPAMLQYLDQTQSVGPNSAAGKRQKRGLNENLAREMLELHTVGVNGGYSQKDVRQLAELLTGIRYDKAGLKYNKGLAEPGAEHVLGNSYKGGMDAIHQFLSDIAVNPKTAEHLSQKLAVHFISNDPDPGLVARMKKRYLDTGGDLTEVYEAMLTHPSAWVALGSKVRTPVEYVAAGLRALGVRGSELKKLGKGQLNRSIVNPLQLMGQKMMEPLGPDGWHEDPEKWITPANLAGRVQWAVEASQRFGADQDPRIFMERTLGELADPALRFAVPKAENKSEGLALVLASPAFNRR